jgi:hypothetical protein
VGKSAADLLTLSGYVRGRLSGAATIVTQLVTHLRLAAAVITCLQSAVFFWGNSADLGRQPSASSHAVPLLTGVNGTATGPVISVMAPLGAASVPRGVEGPVVAVGSRLAVVLVVGGHPDGGVTSLGQ